MIDFLFFSATIVSRRPLLTSTSILLCSLLPTRGYQLIYIFINTRSFDLRQTWNLALTLHTSLPFLLVFIALLIYFAVVLFLPVFSTVTSGGYTTGTIDSLCKLCSHSSWNTLRECFHLRMFVRTHRRSTSEGSLKRYPAVIRAWNVSLLLSIRHSHRLRLCHDPATIKRRTLIILCPSSV